MGASAPDIITYIGVPLAVLGVLPIIYNTIITLITLAKVRRMLRHGRLAGIARGDIVNHIIEVELPRYTLAPLHREEQCKEYWCLCDYPSHIPGGSWTTFNWRRHNTGSKTQRIDYSDQLRQPQAEIGFEELVSFLLDLGAVPDATGFRMLRGSGLWVPTGTPLLLSPDRHEPVLTIAPLDDSDGYLSLAVRWSSNWGMRDPSSLPPYWVLIRGELPQRPTTSITEVEKQPLLENSHEQSPDPDKKQPIIDDETNDLQPRISERPASKTARYTPVPEDSPPAFRCKVTLTGLECAIPEDPDPSLFAPISTSHLDSSTTAGTWFSSALTAHSTTSNTILWNYTIPPAILKFATQRSIPCGVLVLLDFVPESLTPEWATKYTSDADEEREANFRRMNEHARAMRTEALLPPAQKAAAASERALRTHEAWVDGLKAKQRRDAQRAETRMTEALQSPRWANPLIATHCLTFLKSNALIVADYDVKRAVEVLLWRMVNEPIFAGEIASMLDSWQAFVDNGGMRRSEYMMILENKVPFAWATLLVAVIADSTSAVHGSLALDLQECVRVWKKVRLG